MLSMGNLARIAKVIALLLFVLPWVTISCAEQTLVSMSGVDLVTGHISMTNPMTGATESPPGQSSTEQYLVIAGAVLILLSLAVTFLLKGSRGAMAAAIGSAAAAACLAYTVLVRIPNAARADGAMGGAGGGGGAGAGGPSPEQIAQMIQVHIQIGFWLVLAALIAAVVLNVLAMKGAAPAAVATAPPADPPPPGA